MGALRPDVCQKLLPRCLSAVLTFSLDLPLLSLFLTFSPSKFCPPCHPENALVPLRSTSPVFVLDFLSFQILSTLPSRERSCASSICLFSHITPTWSTSTFRMPRRRRQDDEEEEEEEELQALPSDEEEEEEEYEDSEVDDDEEEGDEEGEEEVEGEEEDEVEEVEAAPQKKRKAETDATEPVAKKTKKTEENGEEEDDKDEEEAEDEAPEDDADEQEQEEDEPAVKTKVVKGSESKTTATEAETEHLDDED